MRTLEFEPTTNLLLSYSRPPQYGMGLFWWTNIKKNSVPTKHSLLFCHVSMIFDECSQLYRVVAGLLSFCDYSHLEFFHIYTMFRSVVKADNLIAEKAKVERGANEKIIRTRPFIRTLISTSLSYSRGSVGRLRLAGIFALFFRHKNLRSISENDFFFLTPLTRSGPGKRLILR